MIPCSNGLSISLPTFQARRTPYEVCLCAVPHGEEPCHCPPNEMLVVRLLALQEPFEANALTVVTGSNCMGWQCVISYNGTRDSESSAKHRSFRRITMSQTTCILGHGTLCECLLKLEVVRYIMFQFILAQHVLEDPPMTLNPTHLPVCFWWHHSALDIHAFEKFLKGL